jgi:uncharacterized membrane protein
MPYTTYHTSQITNYTSHVVPTPNLITHTSYIKPHTSHLPYLIHHTSGRTTFRALHPRGRSTRHPCGNHKNYSPSPGRSDCGGGGSDGVSGGGGGGGGGG